MLAAADSPLREIPTIARPDQRRVHAIATPPFNARPRISGNPRRFHVRLHGSKRRARLEGREGRGNDQRLHGLWLAYTLSASNPANIDSVAFTLDAAAATVKAKLVQTSSTYTTCSVSGGTSVTCDFSPDVSVLSADELSVVAVQ